MRIITLLILIPLQINAPINNGGARFFVPCINVGTSTEPEWLCRPDTTHVSDTAAYHNEYFRRHQIPNQLGSANGIPRARWIEVDVPGEL